VMGTLTSFLSRRRLCIMWRIPPISFGTYETSHVISNEVRNLSYLDHDRIGKISRCARDDNNKIKAAIDRRMHLPYGLLPRT
jgi:hypothetical protein